MTTASEAARSVPISPEIKHLRCETVGRGAVVLLLIAGGLASDAGHADAPRAVLQPLTDVPLGVNTTRLDYESLDAGRHLLFIRSVGMFFVALPLPHAPNLLGMGL